MKVYLVYSPAYRTLLKIAGCSRVLISFGVQKWLPNLRLLPMEFSDYMLDSGGYQEAQGTGNRGFYVKSYSYWVKDLLNRYGDRISSYMGLDLEDEEHSFENQCYMEADDLSPVPVWHDGWSDDRLAHYAENYPYVAVGGLVGQKKATRYYTSLARRIISKFPDTKFHFFGMGVTADFFKDYKPYSVDFSTYLNPVKYGLEVILDKTGHLKCSEMDEQSKDRIRHDKEFRREKIIEAIQNLLTLEKGAQ